MKICTTVLFLLLFPSAFSAEPDILIADFENDDYGAWTSTGEAFGPGPARGTLPGQMDVTGFEGRRLVNSFHKGDCSTGTLTSPAFTIERNYINFLIGGGGYAETTCIHLLLGGEVVRTATGPNTAPGGSEHLTWKCWDVTELKGKEVMIRIVDNRSEGWGHINVDQLLQSNDKTSSERATELVVEKRYLNFPVKNGAPKTWVRLLEGTSILREFDIELAPSPEETDFWVPLDLSPFAGRKVILWAENIMKPCKGFDMVTQADGILESDDLYKEKYRPQFHFSPMRGWNNDPNGMVYYEGEYHLFFQHNPYGWNWGNMTWGHAVSTDLIHWEELGDAIHPDQHGTIFSGSAVVDWNNTTGFQTGDTPPLICIYTYAGDLTLSSKGAPFTQALAYSNDRGRTWTKYEGNPVQEQIAGGNRDPKVIWHAPTNQWVIALFLDNKQMAFFTSANLKEWTLASRFEGIYECPEIFQLPVDGDSNREKWIVYGASGDYYMGEFDGKEFKPDGEAIRFNYGDCFYASQTFSDIPSEDGRRIQIAWGQTGHPDMPFNQMMNFPVELTLHSTDEGPRLFAWPVQEVKLLYRKTHTWSGIGVEEASSALETVEGDLFNIHAVFASDKIREFGFTVNGLDIAYDARKQELRCKDKTAPLKPEQGRIELRILADKLSVEIFANQGTIYMPMKHVTEPEAAGIQIFSKGGQAELVELTVYELASTWEQSRLGAYAAKTTDTSQATVSMANGIKIGEVTQDSAIVWTRLTQFPEANTKGYPFVEVEDPKDSRSGTTTEEQTGGHALADMEGSAPGAAGWVRLAYWPETAPGQQDETDWTAVDETADFTRTFPLGNLAPATRYALRVEGKAEESGPLSCSLTGQFQTSPAPDAASPVRFVAVTCGDYPRRDDPEKGHKIYDAMLKLNPDFFVHTGDIEYYDKPLPYAINRGLARFKWNRFFALPFQRTFFQNVSSYFMKDDHETVRNDCWPGQNYGDLTWEQGLAIFREQVPMGERPYRTVRWGKDLQVWMVEGRDFRSPNTMQDGPDKSIWGAEQKAWFKQTVQESDATFRILFSPTPLVGPDRDNKNDNHANDGFAHEGRELRRFIAEQKNMIVINGDRHWQYVSVDDETGLYEFGTGPSSDAHASGWDAGDIRLEHRYLNLKGGFLYVTIQREADICKMTLQHRGVDGEVYHQEVLTQAANP